MQAKVLRALLFVTVLGGPFVANAQGQAISCELPASEVDPLSDRAGILAEYERLPQSCLRELFTACNRASRRTLLDFGAAATCSFGYEALLNRGFGGNFHALLAWWRGQRDQALQ